VVLLIIGAAIVALLVFDVGRRGEVAIEIKSFEECAAAGNPIMESYPRQCKTPDGKTFIEKIDDKSNLIRVTSPTAGEVITSPVIITGEARGNWFFEASFPIVILDANGKDLGTWYAEAQSDWMTTEFVPFKATVSFATSTTEKGKIILAKDNPSGLPEHDDHIELEIMFKNTIAPNTGKCVISGCSSQICSDTETMSTCEYKEEYACYKTATCERQTSGQCGWTETEALRLCLSE